ncbi:MAG: dCMP deaminase family protein [Deltaproteobacteria bacterium]|nr:dCMP deaminase family protein [Deltaproteobacteria bacterium]
MSESQLRWDRYFLGIVDVIAQKSKDPSTKVGCVIVGEDHQILSTGFNGFPRGVRDIEGRYRVRETKYQFIEHADRNAIFNAARTGIALKGSTMYLPWRPCHECTRAIIQSGISRIVVNNTPITIDLERRWGKSWGISATMIIEAGIKISFIDELKESVE